MKLTLRRGEANDSALWAPMRLALWPEGSLVEMIEDLLDMLRKEEFRGWLAFDDDQPIGFVEAYLRPFANGCEGRPVVFLEGIWVKESYRQQGVGHKLFGMVEGWAKDLGLREIGSDAFLGDHRSYQAHRRWGFVEKEKVVHFRKQL